jgi:hypothetical protein
MDKGRVQESLVTLYLRLNGYLTSGFIVHSPVHHENLSELDILAVRFPASNEPERGVDADPALFPSSAKLDVVIAEVKSRGQQFRFNESLRTNPVAARTVLRWIGCFSEGEIGPLANELLQRLNPQDASSTEPPTVEGPRDTRVRGLLFSPESDTHRNNQPWFVPGPVILAFVWKCLRPPTPRPTCATTYDFGLWGPELEPIVQCFKTASKEIKTFKELSTALAAGQPPKASGKVAKHQTQ